jgi:ribosomal-protein-alanine N-acetyltransferase
LWSCAAGQSAGQWDDRQSKNKKGKIMEGKKRFPDANLGIVCLRKPNILDAEAIYKISNDLAVMKYYGMSAYHSINEAKREIVWFQKIYRNNNGIRWVISVKDRSEYIGDIGLHNYFQKHNRAEIGFKLKREYWRKGIMKDTIAFVNQYGFQNLKLNRIEAVVDPRNIPCLKILEKSGYKQEGLLRQYELEEQGYVDLIMLSLLYGDWLEIRAE